MLGHDSDDFQFDSAGFTDLSKFRLLNKKVLEALRKDMAATYIPSWIQSPPANFGSPGHGKLKADQWRTVCTVSMIITLVRLWNSPTASQREKSILQNFVHLVIAVETATRRSMSPARVALFDDHMNAYVRSLREMFQHTLVPNHHMSLHLHECLRLFGPVHAWWAFPFERYNGLIAQLKINNKPCES